MNTPLNDFRKPSKETATFQFSSTKLLLISSFMFTLFLAFIDEGYYSFVWLTEAAGWLVIAIYTSLFFAIQYLLFGVILKSFPQAGRFFALLLITLSFGLIAVLGILHY